MNKKIEKKSPATAATFVEALRKKHGMSTALANEVTHTFLKTIEENLLDDRAILLNRIGKIEPYIQDERVSVIPRTAKRILLNERRLIKWDTSDVILEQLNEGSGNPRTYTELTKEEAEKYIEKHKQRKKK